MKNWKTTLTGLLAGVPMAIEAIIQAYSAGQLTGKTGLQLVSALAMIAWGAFSKDHDKQ